MQQWSVPAWAVIALLVVVVVALVVAVACLVALARARARLAETAALEQRLEDLERQVGETRDSGSQNPGLDAEKPETQREYVITDVGEPAPEPAPAVPGPLFADLVLRESLVRAASLAAGLRRALAPETRNRIRFEMKREVKRARKQRKADLRQARREWEARQRADLEPESAA